MYLELGHIMVQVRNGRKRRTLTSRHTYNNGAIQRASLSLKGSKLALRTDKEVVSKVLRPMRAEALSSYTELFVGGISRKTQEERNVNQRNFTGCVRVWSSANIMEPWRRLRCYGEASNITACTYCSVHEASHVQCTVDREMFAVKKISPLGHVAKI